MQVMQKSQTYCLYILIIIWNILSLWCFLHHILTSLKQDVCIWALMPLYQLLCGWGAWSFIAINIKGCNILTVLRTGGTSGRFPWIYWNCTKLTCFLLIVILASWPILGDLGVSSGGILLPSQHVQLLQSVTRPQCNVVLGISSWWSNLPSTRSSWYSTTCVDARWSRSKEIKGSGHWSVVILLVSQYWWCQ